MSHSDYKNIYEGYLDNTGYGRRERYGGCGTPYMINEGYADDMINTILTYINKNYNKDELNYIVYSDSSEYNINNILKVPERFISKIGDFNFQEYATMRRCTNFPEIIENLESLMNLTVITNTSLNRKPLPNKDKGRKLDLMYKDWDGYHCPHSDVRSSNYWECKDGGDSEKCCKSNMTKSGNCAYDYSPCYENRRIIDTGVNNRLKADQFACSKADLENNPKGGYYNNAPDFVKCCDETTLECPFTFSLILDESNYKSRSFIIKIKKRQSNWMVATYLSSLSLLSYHYKTKIEDNYFSQYNINIYIFPEYLKSIINDAITKLNSTPSTTKLTPTTPSTKSSTNPSTNPTSQPIPRVTPTYKKDCTTFSTGTFDFYVNVYNNKKSATIELTGSKSLENANNIISFVQPTKKEYEDPTRRSNTMLSTTGAIPSNVTGKIILYYDFDKIINSSLTCIN